MKFNSVRSVGKCLDFRRGIDISSYLTMFSPSYTTYFHICSTAAKDLETWTWKCTIGGVSPLSIYPVMILFSLKLLVDEGLVLFTERIWNKDGQRKKWMVFEEAVTERNDMRRGERNTLKQRGREVPWLITEPIMSVEGNWTCVKERTQLHRGRKFQIVPMNATSPTATGVNNNRSRRGSAQTCH